MSTNRPRDITGLDPWVGVSELCFFGCPVFTTDGKVENIPGGFCLTPANEKRVLRTFFNAYAAVRALYRLAPTTLNSARLPSDLPNTSETRTP